MIKSQEKTGPRIPKSDDFFESIPSNLGLEPKHIEGFDPEPWERTFGGRRLYCNRGTHYHIRW